jgi:hypothetical protein
MMATKDEEKYLEIVRKIPSNKKLETAFELYEFARTRVASEILRQNPQIKKTELDKLLRERFAAK